MPGAAIDIEKPILGYVLRERIGSGGYGEVWKADAPGGLTKAIKIVYGFHDEERAVREMKSLDRVKEVRHPFLLSLERIEIVDGQLVVITELADKSLMDRFAESRQRGEEGIPRQELLNYMRDAAEALDYISSEHSLQHLDIKPENLLIVGAHTKVADFGLVKELVNLTNASMMGGLTPTYAPPELFDGRPSRHSDQYSLAIVFQEMLRGVRPFTGSTPAQLASQHLHNEPDLRSLDEQDRPAISRALSKDSEQRFPSCSALVEALSSGRIGEAPLAPQVRSEATEIPAENTSEIDFDSIRQTVSRSTVTFAPLKELAAEVTDLPAETCDASQATIHPTLLVGIGQTGCQVLKKLRRMASDLAGGLDNIPAVRFLCIDTDQKALDKLAQTDGAHPFEETELLPIPLRRPEQYRADQAVERFQWLSRRWLFNIPRSLQTEGIRPLGRLAFVDHVETILGRFSAATECLSQRDALNQTSATLKVPNAVASPSVYIVSSISGGVGSGSVLDVAYGIRKVLSDHGWNVHRIHGILTYWNKANREERELALGNTYACLSELCHYARNKVYPGDDSCLLPALDGAAPFDDTYVIQLGSDRSESRETTLDSLANYLYLSILGPASAMLDAWRGSVARQTAVAVRTFGVSQVGTVHEEPIAETAHMACCALLDTWLDNESSMAPPYDHEEMRSQVQELIVDRGLAVERLCQPLAQYRTRSTDLLLDQAEGIVGSILTDRAIEFGPSTVAALNQMQRGFQTLVPRDPGAESVAALDQLMRDIVELPGPRFARAETMYRMLAVNLNEWRKEVDQADTATQQHVHRLDKILNAASPAAGFDEVAKAAEEFELPPLDSPGDVLREYAYARLQGIALAEERARIDMHESHLKVSELRLKRLKTILGELRNNLDHDRPAELGESEIDDEESDFGVRAQRAFSQAAARLAENLDVRVQTSLLSDGFMETLGSDGFDAANWIVELKRASRECVREEVGQLDLADAFLSELDRGNEEIMEAYLQSAMPSLVTSGGERRLMIATASAASGERLADAIERRESVRPTVLPHNLPVLSFGYEVGQVPLANIAHSLLQQSPNCAKFARRLQTRVDVRWSPLTRNDTTVELQT